MLRLQFPAYNVVINIYLNSTNKCFLSDCFMYQFEFLIHERITRASHGAGDVRLDPFDIEQFGEKIT